MIVNKQELGQLYQQALDDMIEDHRIAQATRKAYRYGEYKGMRYEVTVIVRRLKTEEQK